MGFTHSSRGERAALQSSEPSSRKGSGSREREKLLSTFPPCRGRSAPALAWPCQPSVPPGEGLGSERGDPVPNPSRGRFLASPRSCPSFWGHAAAASHCHGGCSVPAPACPQRAPAPSPAAHNQHQGATRPIIHALSWDYLQDELDHRECPLLAAVPPWLQWPVGPGGRWPSPSLALPGAFCSSDSSMLPRKRWDSARI